MTPREHNQLLSIFFFLQAALGLMGAIFMGATYGGFGAVMLSTAHTDEEQTIGSIMVAAGLGVGLIFLLFAAFHFTVGWKMHKMAPSARIFGIIASCLCLLSIPLGTALGVYGLWFFLGDAGKELYLGQSQSTPAPPSPPPPNSWA